MKKPPKKAAVLLS